jgi:hypothetical protein
MVRKSASLSPILIKRISEPNHTGAADLKYLHRLPQAVVRQFKPKAALES